MAYLLSIDPGISTGIALLEYGDELPATLVQAWQFPGGVQGLASWFDANTVGSSCSSDNTSWELGLTSGVSLQSQYGDQIICERFTARTQTGFSYTTASLEPLECQGYLKGQGLMPFEMHDSRWRDPKFMYFAGGTGKEDKKKRMHAWLREAGFYVTNKMFPDSPPGDKADDARSAIAHGVAFLRGIEHPPTLKEYFS